MEESSSASDLEEPFRLCGEMELLEFPDKYVIRPTDSQSLPPFCIDRYDGVIRPLGRSSLPVLICFFLYDTDGICLFPGHRVGCSLSLFRQQKRISCGRVYMDRTFHLPHNFLRNLICCFSG